MYSRVMAYLVLIIGFVLIYFGGQGLVRSALDVAGHLRWSKLTAGFLIAGLGTSAPELAISSYSAYGGHPGLLIGNVLGSNIANVLLVGGVSALIFPISMVLEERRLNIALIIGSFVLLLIGFWLSYVSWWLGLIMLVFVVGGLFLMHGSQEHDSQTDDHKNKRPLWIDCLIALCALVLLVIGADFIVDGAITVAQHFGVSDGNIGLSLVAIGTSLPELVFSVIAAKQRHTELVIGNIVGSNTFNILLGIGIPSLFINIPTHNHITLSSMIAFVISTLILLYILAAKQTINRLLGATFLVLYILFLVLI